MKKSKKGKLLFQMGAIFSTIFVLVGGIFAAIQVIGNTSTYMEAKREHLTQTMKYTQSQVEKYIPNLEWYVAFWRTHAEQVKAEAEAADREIFSERYEKVSELLASDRVASAELDALPEDTKLAAAGYAYMNFSAYMKFAQWQLSNEVLFVVDAHPETCGFLYEIGGGDSTVQVGTHLGDPLFMDEEDTPESLQAYMNGETKEPLFERHESRKDGTYFYVGFYPVVKNGEIIYVVGILHDWSEYRSTLIRNLIILVVISLAVLALAGFILLHFVNRTAVKPLKKIQNAVRVYQKDKNSENVIEKMDRITARNELGELSTDISDLVEEIDRYNDENTRLVGERKRVETELSLAAAIQNGVLPKVFPDEQDYRLFASMTPAKEVGGDFYDFFSIDDTHVGLAIGDVSGKGVPASLFMMITKMLIKQNAMAGYSPAEILKRTNDTICEENARGMFVTAWFGILDRTTGKIVASSAGHEYPMLRDSDGEFTLLKDKHGFVLGGMEMSKYTEYEICLAPGATIFLYTDGAAEATSAAEELFGTDRMLEALNRDPGLQPEELCGAMTDAIDAFVGEAPQFDDLTMLCIRYNGRN